MMRVRPAIPLLLVCCLLGAATTILSVAYLAFFGNSNYVGMTPGVHRVGSMVVDFGTSHGGAVVRTCFGVFDRIGTPPYAEFVPLPSWSYVRSSALPVNSRSDEHGVGHCVHYTELAYGTPLLAMKGLLRCDLPRGAWTGPFTAESGFLLPMRRVPVDNIIVFQERVLPVRPIWSGFLLNSLLFAACWFAALVSARAARSAFRRRRHLCPQCAYDLRDTPSLSPCPECGSIPRAPDRSAPASPPATRPANRA